jgi:predicted alpha/beta hydrolase family esterase
MGCFIRYETGRSIDASHGIRERPVTRQVLFVQGGGAGTHDEWDDKLVDSLRGQLGAGFEVRYPRMPDEGDPRASTWVPVIRQEIASLDVGAVLVGHSVGATILVHALEDHTPARPLAAIVLVAAPFVGAGGWPGDEFQLSDELGDRLPRGVPVHLFYGSADDTVPPAHAELYARAIPQAQVHLLPGRDHQLGNDLGVVAEVIRALAPPPPPGGR